MSNISVNTHPKSEYKPGSHYKPKPNPKSKPAPEYKSKSAPEYKSKSAPKYKSKPAPVFKPQSGSEPKVMERLTKNLLAIKRCDTEQEMRWNTLKQTLKTSYPWQVYSLFQEHFPNNTTSGLTVDKKFEMLEDNKILHMNNIMVLWNKCIKSDWIRSKLMDEIAVYAYTFNVGISHEDLTKAGYILE